MGADGGVRVDLGAGALFVVVAIALAGPTLRRGAA